MPSSGDGNSTDDRRGPESTKGEREPRSDTEQPASRRVAGEESPQRRQPEFERQPDQSGETSGHSEWKLFVYDVVSSVLAVAVIGAYLFAVSGVWPPLVAVESGSMEPNMQVNDLVFVMEENRFPGAGAHSSGVVTARAGAESAYRQFGGYGDVIVYQPDGRDQATPIIHRAMFWVEAGENWCEQANPDHLGGVEPGADRCIADHSGFITKGDNNARYDQIQGLSDPVKPEWVVGTAQVRVPGLGWIRLQSAG